MNAQRMLAYADWSGMRPMTVLEMNKVSYGPLQPQALCNSSGCWYPSGNSSVYNTGALIDVGSYDSSSSTRATAGSSYYGVDDLTGNAREHVVSMNFLNFNSTNGDGSIGASGNADVNGWNPTGMLILYEQFLSNNSLDLFGIRYVRSAE
jgi:hypothetical protein